MNNTTIRKSIRKYIKHYGEQDTRKVISMFACACNTSKLIPGTFFKQNSYLIIY